MAADPNPPVSIETDAEGERSIERMRAASVARGPRPAPPLPLEAPRPEVAQFLRFAIVGASGVAVNVSVFLSVLAAWALANGHHPMDPFSAPVAGASHLPAMIANACGFVVSVVTNYALNRGWTFRSRGSVGAEIPRFVLVSLAAYAGQLAVFWIALTQLHLARPLAQLAAIACVMPVNFVANKWWSFRDRRS